MKPRGLSQNGLARALNVPPRRVNEIVLEKREEKGQTVDWSQQIRLSEAVWGYFSMVFFG
jgi:plasmid maintenance system antidote protein VapI